MSTTRGEAVPSTLVISVPSPRVSAGIPAAIAASFVAVGPTLALSRMYAVLIDDAVALRRSTVPKDWLL